jgi:hypothetical protein
MSTRHHVDVSAVNEFLSHMNFKHEYLTSLGPDLYHYTDLAGLKGIVKDHDLWLTHSQYCNDEEEMTHGYAVASLAIEEARKSGAFSSSYLDRIVSFLEERDGVYICCFCKEDNLLSQWRIYAANGTGVSIRIQTAWFSQFTGPDCFAGLLRFWTVYYDADKQLGIIQEAIGRFSPANHLNQGQSEEQLARKAADAIQFFIPTFKNPDFREEEEWRLIFTPFPNAPPVPITPPLPGTVPPWPQPRFRVSVNKLVPYYSLREIVTAGQAPQPPQPKQHIPLPIVGVHIGPSPHKRLNEQSVRMLLSQSRYPVDNIRVSSIPYRGY